MPAVPNRDRRSAAADAAERRAAAAAPREDAAVAGQAAAVGRLIAMGFTAEQARCALAQGFASVEEAVDFLFAGWLRGQWSAGGTQRAPASSREYP